MKENYIGSVEQERSSDRRLFGKRVAQSPRRLVRFKNMAEEGRLSVWREPTLGIGDPRASRRGDVVTDRYSN